MRNDEYTIHISLKRKDGAKGSSQSIHKDSVSTKWTVTGASGKTYPKMSTEQVLSHLFKALISGKAIVEIVPDSPENAVSRFQLLASTGYDNQDKLDIGH